MLIFDGVDVSVEMVRTRGSLSSAESDKCTGQRVFTNHTRDCAPPQAKLRRSNMVAEGVEAICQKQHCEVGTTSPSKSRMPQTLYRFGVDSTSPTAEVNTPIPIITNAEINILWSSWCDLIHTTLTHDFERTVIYLGTGLNTAQQLDLQSDFLKSCLSGMRHSTLTTRDLPRFFGTAMHDGVRGYVVNRKVTTYGTSGKKGERDDSFRDIASWEIPRTICHPLAEVSMCSDESLLVVCRSSPGPESGCEELESASAVVSLGKGNDKFYEGTKAIASRASTVNLVKSLQNLREYCSTETSVDSVADFAPTRLVVNATTSTILDEDGRVHTRTTDPRYPACLGRP